MTDFTPQHYLAAARMCPPKKGYQWKTLPIGYFEDEPGVFLVQRRPGSKYGDDVIRGFDPERGDYRALREALDKEYGINIYWNGAKTLWQSTGTGYGVSIGGDIDRMFDDDITRLMMKNVVALVEAGVLNPVLTD